MTKKNCDPINTIHGLYTRYRNGSDKPSSVVQNYLEEARRLDPVLGAYEEIWTDTALEMASVADKAFKSGSHSSPFCGIPFALKDIFHVKDKVTTCGSAALVDNFASQTSTVVARLLSAGGIILGKTKTVECAFGGWGTNQKMGTPRNPWDMMKHRIPGGSSSGSAVAVASSMASCAVGSDTGGSVRLPAAFCGLVGLKVTADRLPTDGIMPLSQTLDTPGPITQTVLDSLIMFDVLDGREGEAIKRDLDKNEGTYGLLSVGVSGLHIGSLSDEERQYCSNEVLDSYDMTLDRLCSLGATLVKFENPTPYNSLADDNGMITAVEAFHNHGHLYKNLDLPMDEDVRARMLAGESFFGYDYFGALQRRMEIKASFKTAMIGLDALVTPTTTTVAPQLAEIDQAISPGHFTRPFNFLEMCGLSIPINLDSNGLPTSLQIVGAAHNEATCLQIGAALENVLPSIGKPALD